ncbi:MmgE/PrpD family protein [Pigmentiphaga humi]|uniref:MmgE/PrpD family protein n=1 Tax=Pigmentiphaga humi TaxID=2478468 RepID=A0A3P4AX61_9BURK|nr:MmgE/PrpD family protein [Pigmentiphaga humi]VCU68038.1 MmgE/PrpD family protein [Pigmentiphaga humi]
MMQSSFSPAEGFGKAVCGSFAALRFDDIPDDVMARLKLFLLDSIGTVAAGVFAPGVEELARRLARWESSGSATVLGRGRRVSPPSAAMVNAAAAHALDFDDQHDPTRVHSYCCVVPAVLATAEDLGNVSGEAILEAVACGVEFHARLGDACMESFERGWMPTVTFGTLASAMAAGKILGLDADGLANAVGLAYHQASGNGQARTDQTLAKRLGPGFAARSGVLSAFLAADGVTGPHRALEGRDGLFRLYLDGRADASRLQAGLGTRWYVSEFSMKPYPGCRCNHTVIDMGTRLHAEKLDPEAIERVQIYLGEVNYSTVQGKYDPELGSQVHAQFNAAYNLARAIIDGGVSLASFSDEAIRDERVASLAARIDAFVDPGIPVNATGPARLKVFLRDGGEIELSRDTMPGSPARPLSVNAVRRKFEDCVVHGLGADTDKVQELASCILDIEHSNIECLVAAFPAGQNEAGKGGEFEIHAV